MNSKPIFSALLLLLSYSGVTVADMSGKPFSFALIGDVPYGAKIDKKDKKFERLLTDINADDSLKWVLHAGDIKGGGEPCSDAMLLDRKARFMRFNKPFIYTPGDNEWTDCHRVSAGQFSPRERLTKLREIFFSPVGKSLGGKVMTLQSQATMPGFADYQENLMWSEQGVLFATIHLVGSNNAMKKFDKHSSQQRSREDDDEVKQRNRAALAWLETVFSKAKREQAPGVLIMIHANPGLDFLLTQRKPFNEFLFALQDQVEAFAKPVVLAHGDTHTFRIDRPALADKGALRNFTRVESYGDKKVHWVKINVDPNSTVVFTYENHRVEGN